MPVSREQFRKILGHFATGVTVVTARLASGKRVGFTVNSFTAVSLSPPLVLFCVDHSSDSFRAMSAAKHFAVNFLGEDQEEISRRFASKSVDRFENVATRDGAHGSPLLEGCLGYVECRKVAAHPHGEHTIMIGEVLEGGAREGHPLLFFRSAYARLPKAASMLEK